MSKAPSAKGRLRVSELFWANGELSKSFKTAQMIWEFYKSKLLLTSEYLASYYLQLNINIHARLTRKIQGKSMVIIFPICNIQLYLRKASNECCCNNFNRRWFHFCILTVISFRIVTITQLFYSLFLFLSTHISQMKSTSLNPSHFPNCKRAHEIVSSLPWIAHTRGQAPSIRVGEVYRLTPLGVAMFKFHHL